MKITSKEKRGLLFEYISSIELDMRDYLIENGIDIPTVHLDKSIERYKVENLENHKFDRSDLFYFLDFNDYIEIMDLNYKELGLNEAGYKRLSSTLKKITPIRNRVMHNRPLQQDDETILYSFIGAISEFKKIIPFNHIEESIHKYAKNPNFIFDNSSNDKKVYISRKVIHNLPFVDYDDTGFIGRASDKANLMAKINGPYPVISIIGDGGIGKTALVLNCLYEILENGDDLFERIIWVNLKTKSLQDGEFKDILNHF